MNEEELRALVARARDAEGSPSQPPPGLVDEARTAARRRHRLVTVAASGVVAAVVLTSFAGPRLLADETDPGVDDSLSGVNTGELAAHGGPCPSTLPAPIDDVGGHGFGTSTPAERGPRFAAPETAWVCQYSTREIGKTDSGGTAYEWSLTNTPRRLDDALLSQVTEAMNGIAVDPDSETRACTADLGPRYALVSSAGGDLTGIVVDDFGCRQVRLTNNPFVTAPGDPQEGGTVAGVLTGADGFAATLATWWDTSPADVEAGPTPDELRVTCTDNGPQVETTIVTATPAGVLVVVDSTMSKRSSYLTYTSDGPSGGDAIDQITSPATYAFPPGEVTLGCASPPHMDETTTATVEVVDPYGYWRTSTLAEFGCAPGAQPSWAVFNGKGPTAQDAVDDLLAKFADVVDRDASDYTAEPAPTGYSGAESQTWVGFRRGSANFSILVTGSGTSFTANPDMLCGPR